MNHLIMNYSLVLKVSEYLGINFNDALKQLSDFKMYKQRMNIINKNNFQVIDDAYNASFESVIGDYHI